MQEDLTLILFLALVGSVSGLTFNETGFSVAGKSYQWCSHHLNSTYAMITHVCNGKVVFQNGNDCPAIWQDYYENWNVGPSTSATSCTGWGDCTFCYFTC